MGTPALSYTGSHLPHAITHKNDTYTVILLAL